MCFISSKNAICNDLTNRRNEGDNHNKCLFEFNWFPAGL